MNEPLLQPERAMSSEGPFVTVVKFAQAEVRSTAAHSHSRGQLIGASQGLMAVGFDQQQWVVPAVHAIWIPPHWVHSLQSFGPFSGWSVYLAEYKCATLPILPRAIKITGLLLEAVRRAATWPDVQLDAAQMRIGELIIDEIKDAKAEALELVRPQDARLRRITDALGSDLSDTRRLAQWAAWAGLSTRTLSRHFVEETGLTFAQWRQQARLLRALELIAEKVPITNIALELGYDNASAFIDMFRRATGTTPGRYTV